jgi:glutathione S-transferase
MSRADSSPIVFYDIAFRTPCELTACAPNPWKSRLALNYKAISYTTTWVPMPDVEKVRRSIHLPACRRWADGSDFYTLPAIVDANTDVVVGDSFDIAVYLQERYPDSGGGDLFPEQKLDYEFTPDQALHVPLSEIRKGAHDEYARFNANVDTVFTTHTLLMMQCMPLDQAGKDVFVKRAGAGSWQDMAFVGEPRKQLMTAFEDNLCGLASVLAKDQSGPFILGAKASYADMIICGWLRFASKGLLEDEWNALRSWHGRVFGQLHDALEKYSHIDKGRGV